MTILAKMRQRLPLVVTAASGGLVVTLVTTVALMSQGYPRQELDLDDASVWVTNGSEHLVGHANTEIAALSTAVSSNSSDISLIQDPSHLVVHDRSNNTLDLIDPAGAVLTATVPLPTGVPEVESAGSKLLMYLPESGDVWISAVDDLAGFDAKSSAVMSLGVNAVLAADDDEHYLGYSMKSKQLVTGSLSGDDGSAQTTKVSFSSAAKKVQATLVGGTPVLYNPNSNELWIDGTLIALGEEIEEPSSAMLMKPSTDGQRVLIAHDGGLVSVPLSNKTPVTIGQQTSGTAAAPVRVDGCDYAAWSNGIAYRACGPSDPTELALDAADPGAALTLSVNGKTVVANDQRGGKTWAVQREGQLINNWGDFIDDTEKVESEEDDRDVPPELDPQQKPPLAVDDEFGIRAGRANTLPVLLNDSDPNGDAIVISEVSAISPEYGRIDVVGDAQRLQLSTRDTASGAMSFEYTVTDGHGNSAKAAVTVTVVGADVNSAPQQARPTRTSVASGGKASINVLTDWVDPESDPFYLVSATATEPDIANFTPDGLVEFIDSGSPGELKGVALAVSDGAADGNGSLTITVGAVGTVPIIAESFAVTGYTGQQIEVEPLPNTRGGTGTITLSGATASAGDGAMRIAPEYTNGTFTVATDVPGTHYIEYSVTDGEQTASGLVRLEAQTPPNDKLPPVTVPATAFLYLQNTEFVDVLATDYDPAGGVLNILNVGDIPDDSGIVVEIVDQRILRVTLKKALENGPVTISYVVTNGSAEATGTVTLVQIPEPTKLQAPVANPDSVTVRVGSVVDIPVMDNDHQPNGKPLLLESSLVENVGDGAGTLFAAQDTLRYLAPDKPGEYSAVYKISSTDGQWATATVSITVRDFDAANNRPPAPKTLVARVTAGQTVTIPIPLAGIDPDGDIVELVGQASSPQLGAISGTGTASLTYAAGPYSAGTDTFQYTVVDGFGAIGTGSIRIGISPSTGVTAPPIAMDDLVTTRPGAHLNIRVTDNDSDPDQGVLTVTTTESSSDAISPTFTNDTVTLTAPSIEGGYGVLYTIQNPRGGTSSAWLFVQVDKNAPLIKPVANDVVLTLQDIDGRETVSVNVLAAVRFSEGTKKDLLVDVPAGYDGVSVGDDGDVSVPVAKKGQIIPFSVARVDDPTVSSMAFIWVPGTDDAKPEILANAPRLTVPSGDTLSIPVNDYVIAASRKKVTITDSSTVSATSSNGAAPMTNDTTLSYTSAPGYWGPASITFTVTDGTNKATITLPITVTPKDNQPPVFNGASIPLEAGAETTIDLVALTDYPYADAAGKLSFTAATGSTNTVNATVSGSKLTIRAVDGAAVGSETKIAISVKDSTVDGTSGVISVSIVRSTRPLVSAIPDSLIIRRGESKSIDVLANDDVTNPFPGRPLRVVSVGGGSALPSGVSVTPSADKSKLSITVGENGPTGDITFAYQVTDITNDPNRYSSGTVSVRIQDVPDAPTSAPRKLSQDNEKATVTLALPHAFPNYSEISKYVVTSADGTVMGECANPDSCVISGLVYGQPYQFRTFAKNEVGEGAPSSLSETVVVDLTPNPPSNVTLVATADEGNGHSMRASWGTSGQITSGTPISSYEIVFTGPGVNRTLKADASASSIDIIDGGIQPTAVYSVSIRASNKTNTGEPGVASGTAVGPPSVSTVDARVHPLFGVHVSWTNASAGGSQNLQFFVGRAQGGEVQNGVCAQDQFSANADASGWTDSVPPRRTTYVLKISNGLYCRTFLSGEAPIQPDVTGGSARVQDTGNGTSEIYISGLSASTSPVDHYEYSLVDAGQDAGAWAPFSGTEGYLPADGNAYGRAKDLLIRACTASWAESCGDPSKRGSSLIPLRTWATVAACTVDGQPPVINQPNNNGLTGYIEVSYNPPDVSPTIWYPADVPPPGPGLSISTRITINNQQFTNPSVTPCA